MTTKATADPTRNSIPAAVAIVVLGATLIGCADPVALQYAHDAHAREVGAWCYAYSPSPTAAPQAECVPRAWANIPPSQYWIEHESEIAPCRCGSGSAQRELPPTGEATAPANGSSASTDLIRTSAGRTAQPSEPNPPRTKRAAELLEEFEKRLADHHESLKPNEGETQVPRP
jgi:hypothetical protein